MPAESVRRAVCVTNAGRPAGAKAVVLADDRHVLVRRVPFDDCRVQSGPNAMHHDLSPTAVEVDVPHTLDAVTFPNMELPWRGSSRALHAAVGEDAVDAAVGGVDAGVVFLGPTGSGKTTAVIGDPRRPDAIGDTAGLLQLVARDLHTELKAKRSIVGYTVALGVLSIREEIAYDMLSGLPRPGASPSRSASRGRHVSPGRGRRTSPPMRSESPQRGRSSARNAPTGRFNAPVHVRRLKDSTDVPGLTWEALDASGLAMAHWTAQARPQLQQRGAHFIYFLKVSQIPADRTEGPTTSTVLLADLAADVDLPDDEGSSPMGASPVVPSAQAFANVHAAPGVSASEQCKVNQSKTMLRRLIGVLQRRADGESRERIPTRESQLTKIVVDYFATTTRTAIVAVLPSSSDADEALHTLADLESAGHIRSRVTFDDRRYQEKIAALAAKINQMTDTVYGGPSEAVLEKQAELDERVVTIETWGDARDRRLQVLHDLEQRLVVQDEEALRQERAVEQAAALEEAKQQCRAAAEAERERQAEERQRELMKNRPVMVDASCGCNLDEEEEARLEAEAARNEADISRMNAATRWSATRRRRIQAFLAAQASVQRDLRIHQHAQKAMKRRVTQLEDRLEHCRTETNRLNHLEERYAELQAKCQEITAETIREEDDRDERMAQLNAQIRDLVPKRDQAVADEAEAQEELAAATAQCDEALRIHRRRVTEADDDLLEARGQYEVAETEADLLERDLREWEQRRVEVASNLDDAKQDWEDLRRRDAALPEFAVGEQRQATARATDEAAQAEADLEQAQGALQVVNDKVARTVAFNKRLEDAIADAHRTIREKSLPDADPVDFADHVALSEVVRNSDFSARLQDHDARAQISADLYDKQESCAASLPARSIAASSRHTSIARSRSRSGR